MNTILGIDPGANGAIAMVQPDVCVWDMPDTPHDLSALLRTFDAATTRVYLEKQWARPTDGKVQAFANGEGYGLLRGVMATLGIAYELVAPATWKLAMGLRGKEKADSRQKAQELYPTAPLARVKDHGRAEALLIAHFGHRVLGGTK